MSNQDTYRAILYFYFQDYIYGLPEEEKKKFIANGFFGKVKSAFVTLGLTWKRNRDATRVHASLRAKISGKRWVFIFGKNNYEATKFLGKNDFVFVTDSPRKFKTENEVYVLPVRLKFVHYLNFLPLLKYLYRKEGRRALLAADAIFASQGWLQACEEIIKEYAPEAIVFSNDHSFVPRAMFWAAKRLAVPTIYIQHASISRYMPPLHFDLSLLEGEDALEKYKAKGIFGEVKLIGMPRVDGFLNKRKSTVSTTVRTLGVAFNTVDSLEKIEQLVRAIVAQVSGVVVMVRPHPKDKREIAYLLQKFGSSVAYSDSRETTAFDFIAACDLIVAGDTSIHLEAKILNVHSFYYNLSETSQTYDLYGYIKNGFVEEYATPEHVVAGILQGFNADNIYQEAQYYNALIGTPMEGKSTEVSFHEIGKFLNNRHSN